VLLVKFHYLLIHGVTVVLVLLTNLGHFRLQLLHILHRLVTLVSKRKEKHLENDRL